MPPVSRRLPRVHLDLDSPRSTGIYKYLSGRCDFYRVVPGLACRVDDGQVKAPFRELHSMPGRRLLMQFRLKSPSAVHYAPGERHQRLAPHFALIKMQPGSTKEEHFVRGQQDCVITLQFEPGYLRRRLLAMSDDMPAWLSGFLQGEDRNSHTTHRLSAAMRSAANDILNADPNAGFFTLLLNAKCEELLWHGLGCLQLGSSDPARVAEISQGESEKIERAAQRLLSGFPDLPPISVLAQEMGLSQWKLNRGFKALFGMTVSEYVVDMRIQRARALLAESRLSIQDIAVEVGYDFLTNFSKAFKRAVGVSPREYRDAL